MREEIPALLGGERLDRIVAMLCDVSRAEASELVEAGRVSVDGRAARDRSARLAVGSILEVEVAAVRPAVSPAPDPDVDLVLLHVDDDVIVVDKPAGLVVHPGAGNHHGTLVNGLLARFPEIAGVGDPQRPGVVQRLDKGTSGLLAVARSPDGYEALVAQLSARTVARCYDALAWGVPSAATGLIDAPIGRSRREPTRMTVASAGREARTRYEVVAAFGSPQPAARLACRLETGRTHQIRVHLAAIGHPVVGDERYGGVRAAVATERPFLHASHLGFRHPSGAELAFDSPLPADLEAVLARFTA